ncbi:serine carboxypeptidase-like 19 isoform X7 [Capsicum annuum]|uniref:serine carboxypeptidase-like 19 isoform X7 n=1 Tax=Capsicum annuum TaxID=4072 RepID=UPI0007BFD399|nr:serine carboxypeptidase-like 19 isoform X7 [Capsicum annuum]
MSRLVLPILFLIVVFEIIYPQPALAGLPVKYLPGFEGSLPFQLETGYIGVGEADEVQLFYYFIKSQSNPKIDPLIYWFTGGPGCSPLSAILYELGPVTLDIRAYNGSLPTLSLNPYAYTKVANMIFVDLPVGTGFSYATTQKANYSDDLQSAHYAYEFLRKWFVEHQEYLKNPFYVAGDSYSGITVPIVTEVISNGIDMGIKPWINLKLVKDIYQYNILEPPCELASYESRRSLIENIQKLKNPATHSGIKCRGQWHDLGLIWANDKNVQDALHVRKKTNGAWEECRSNISFGAIIDNTIPYHENLSRKGFRSLIYSGDHDMVVPFISTEAWITSLNYPIVVDWKPWIVDGQVAGYTRSYSNQMTFATVKGGGHTAPESKPVECFSMLKRWLSYEPL